MYVPRLISVVVKYEVGVSKYISTQRPIDIRYSNEIIFILNISYILTSCITGMDIKKTAIATYEATERCIHHLYLLQYRRGYIMLVTKNRSG